MRWRMVLFGSLATLVLLLGFGGPVQSQPERNKEAGKFVKGQGCVRQGVEAGCLVVKCLEDQKEYNLLFPSAKKPAPNTAISFEGTIHKGPTICMQGTPVRVSQWTALEMQCPEEKPKQHR